MKPTNKLESGTSFFGDTIITTLSNLKLMLGEPHYTGDTQSKVQNEWLMETNDGEVFTVYDWKLVKGRLSGKSIADKLKINESLLGIFEDTLFNYFKSLNNPSNEKTANSRTNQQQINTNTKINKKPKHNEKRRIYLHRRVLPQTR